MKPLYSPYEFSQAKYNTPLPLECHHCQKTFYKTKCLVKYGVKHEHDKHKFCSSKCRNTFCNPNLKIETSCTNCGKKVLRTKAVYLRSKSKRFYCNHSCRATFTNKNKTHGTRRSKLEAWLESELTQLYPDLDLVFNGKETIGSELDIYIPSLNLAFEINGIFHYEPIYGVDKLGKIQENDQSKSLACHEAKIDLCIIDVSQQKYVKPSTSQKYLDIIVDIIEKR